MTIRRELLRRRWARVALLSSVALVPVAAGPAMAQDLRIPDPVNATDTTIVRDAGAGRLDVQVDRNRVIDWTTFNVGAQGNASFNNNTGTRLTVVNRVTTANNPSEILGAISAQNVNFWLSNPSGVVFGPNATFNGGSLVLTTAQLTGVSESTIGGLASATLATMAPDARITVAGGGTGSLNVSGNLLIAAQQIAVNGVVRAIAPAAGTAGVDARVTGTIDLVAARDARIDLALGSPIGVTILTGTTLGQLDVAGDLAATEAVRLRGSAAAGDLLLGIQPAAALRVIAANGRVEITALEDGGTARVAASGTIAARAGGLAIAGASGVVSTAQVSARGTLDPGNDPSVGITSARGSVVLSGDVEADNGFVVAGNGITLTGPVAGSLSSLTVRGGRAITVDSGTGTLAATGQVALVSDAADAVVTLTSGGTGGIAFGPGVAIRAGVASGTTVDERYSGTLAIRPGSAPVTLGTVDAGRIDLAGNTLAGDFTAERLWLTDGIDLTTGAGALRLGDLRSFTGAVTLAAPGTDSAATADTRFVLVDRVQAEGNVTIRALGDVAGRGTSDALATPRGRASLFAVPAGSTIAVIAGGIAQLGDVRAGGAIGTVTAGLDQITIAGTRVDVATGSGQQLVAGQGNAALTATGVPGTADPGAGELRIGVGTVAGGFVAGTAPGVVAGGDARIGSLTAENGDIRLLVPGALTGLTPSGATIVDGLTLANAAIGNIGALAVTTPGDATIGDVAVTGGASVDAGGNVRIGSLRATALAVTARQGAVTGVATVAAPIAGATLVARRGSVVLPSPTTLPGGASAAFDTVSAGTDIMLKAGRLSIGTASAGGAAMLTATGSALVVGTLSAGTATLSTGVANGFADVGGDTVDRGDQARLRGGFGFANLTTTNGALTVTANTAAQLGRVIASDQITVNARAITAQLLTATNGNLLLTATAGDLYLGQMTGETATGVTTAASAGGTALLDKQGTAGLVRIAGRLTAGGVTVRSTTDVVGREVLANTGDIRVEANGIVAGFGGAAAEGGLVLGSGSAGSATLTAPGDIRIGALKTTLGLAIESTGGSVTGLGGTALPTPALDLIATAGRVDVGGLTNPLGSATLGQVTAPLGIGVTAGAVAIGVANTGGTLALTASGAPGVDAEADRVTVIETDRKLRSAYGFATLDAGTTIAVGAARVAQIASAGAGQDVTIVANAITLGTATAINGALGLTARTGDLYLGRPGAAVADDDLVATVGRAGTAATLVKGGGAGSIWISGRLSAAGNVAATSATGLRGRIIESGTGDIGITAATLVGGLGTVDADVADPVDGRLLLGLQGEGLTADRRAFEGVRLATGEAGGFVQIDAAVGTPDGIASDVRIGRLLSRTGIGIGASGSVTGLAGADRAVGASLDLLATNGAITVGPATGAARPASVVLDEARALRGLTIAAGRIAVGTAAVTNGDVSLLAGRGIAVDLLGASGGALLRVDAPAVAAAAVNLTDADGVQQLAPGYDRNSGRLRVDNVSGRVVVDAGQVVQLADIDAGAGSVTLAADTSGSRDQARIGARAIDLGSVTARGGGIALTATAGGLYLGQGIARLGATVTKTGSISDAADVLDNIVRIRTLETGRELTSGDPASDIAVTSTTSIRGDTLTAFQGDIATAARREITGLTRQAGPTSGLTIGDAGDARTSLIVGTATLGGAGDVRVRDLSAGGAMTITAGGSVTGLRAEDRNQTGINLIAGTAPSMGRGRVAVTGLSPDARVQVAVLGQVLAGAGSNTQPAVQVLADSLSAKAIVAGGAVSLLGTRGVSAGFVTAGSLFAQTTDRGTDPGDIGLSTADDAAAGADPIGGVVTSTGDRLAPAAGFARLTAGDALSVVAGDPARASGFAGVAQLGTVSGTSVSVTANALTVQRNLTTDTVAATARTGALTLTARQGGLYLGSGRATGDALLVKTGSAGDTVRGNEVRIGTVTGTEDATTLKADAVSVTSATGIRAARLVADAAPTEARPAAMTLTATMGAITGLRGDGAPVSGRVDPAPDWGRADLTASAPRAGITVTASGLAKLGTVVAGVEGATARSDNATAQLLVRAQATDILVADVRNGALTLATGSGETSLANGRGWLQALVTGEGAVRIGALRSDQRNVTVTAGGDATGLLRQAAQGTATDGRLVTGYDRADLSAAADDLTAAPRRIAVTAGGTMQLGKVSAGSGTTVDTTLNQIMLRAAAIDAATAQGSASMVVARNGNLVIDATQASRDTNAGRIRIGEAIAGGGIVGIVGTGAEAGRNDGIVGRAGVEIGKLTATTGNIGVRSIGGSVTGLILPGDGVSGGTTTGRANMTAAANGRMIGVKAANSARLGTLTAGSGAPGSDAEQIGVDAAQLDVTAATAFNGAIGLRAGSGPLTLGTGNAATSATLTKTGMVDKLSITGTLTAGNAVMLASSTDVDLGGAVRATAGTGTIRIDATAASPVFLGGAAAGTGFALGADELNRLDASTITIDARGNGMTIGDAALGNGGSNRLLQMLGTGDVTLNGAVTASGINAVGEGRTLRIGGDGSATATDVQGAIQPGRLATRLIANLGGARIGWAGGTVDLRARQIVFGNASLQNAVAGRSQASIASDLVANPNSVLYRGTGAGEFLTAKQLQVRYTDYALFQNTGGDAVRSVGVVLNAGAASTAADVALQLFARGDGGQDSFALFGTINGAVDRTAGLLPDTVLQFASGDGGNRTVRITQANSRVNGCVIGSPDRGCLNVDSPPPLLRLFDERAIQLFGTDDNPDILFESLIGTNNEALIGDLTGIDTAATPDCPTGQEAGCPSRSSPPAPTVPATTPATMPQEVKP